MKKIDYLTIIFHTLIMIIALIFDYTKLFFYKNSSNFIFSNNIALVVTILISIFAILITLYSVYIQVLRKNFTKKEITNFILKEMGFSLISLPLTTIFGFIILLIKFNYYYSIYILYFLFFANIVIIIINFFYSLTSKKKSIFWIDTIINSIGEKLITYIEKANDEKRDIPKEFLKHELFKIDKYFDQALNNNQTHIIDRVLYSSLKVYKAILINKNKIILESKKCSDNKDNINQIIKSVCEHLAELLDLSLKCNSDMSRMKTLSMLLQIQEHNYDCNEYDCFHAVNNEVNDIVKSSNRKTNIYYIPSIYSELILYILKKNKEEENPDKAFKWINYNIAALYTITQISYIYSNSNLLQRIVEIYFFIFLSLTKEGYKFYEFEKLEKNLETTLVRLNSVDETENNYINTILTRLTDEIIDTNSDELIIDYVRFLSSLIEKVFFFEKKQAIYSIAHSLNEISKKNYNKTVTDKIYEIQKKLSLNLASLPFNPEILNITIPDYYKILDDINDDNKFKNYINDFEEITYKAIEGKQLQTTLLLLNYINEFSYKLKVSDKNKQKIIVELYIDILKRSINNNDIENFYASIQKLKNLLKEFDNTGNFSIDLFHIIVSKLYSTCQPYFDSNKTNYISGMIDFLHDMTELHYAAKQASTVEYLVNHVYEIGLFAIEYSNNSILKKVSNILGWIAKNYIDSGNRVFRKVLESSRNLINIYLKVNGKPDLIVIFMGTLFIVLGAIVKDRDMISLEHSIISYTNTLTDISFIENSKLFREYTFVDCTQDNFVNLMGGTNCSKNVEHIYKQIISRHPSNKK